jgi:predicted TIM-barrel fold metal-dependent hydrolase
MWSSDYPHSETTFPNSMKVVEDHFAEVPYADKKMILGQRAKGLFRVGDGLIGQSF